MGFGFVLIGLGIVSLLLSIPILGAAYFPIYFLRKRKGKSTSFRQLLKFGFVVPLVLVYCFFSFLLTAVFNEYVRGVDPGIGDGWTVPIGNGYKFTMIDVTVQGSIKKGDEAILTDVVKVDVLENAILGQTTDSSYFTIDLLKDGLSRYSKEEFRTKYPSLKLKSPDEFYTGRRNRLADISLGFFAIILPSILLIRYWYRKTFV